MEELTVAAKVFIIISETIIICVMLVVILSVVSFSAILCSIYLTKETKTRLIFRRINNLNFSEGFLEVPGSGVVYSFEGSLKQNYRNARVACTDLGKLTICTYGFISLAESYFKYTCKKYI